MARWPDIRQPVDLALATPTIYGVPMFVNVVRLTPRFVLYLLVAVALSLLAFAVAAASLLGFTLALEGWATNPTTTIQTPVER